MMGSSNSHWTLEEYEVVGSCSPKEAMRRLPRRTYRAILTARRNLRANGLPTGLPGATAARSASSISQPHLVRD